MDNNVLVPVQQALIPFHGSEILAVRLSDERVVANFKSLCTLLGIRSDGQARLTPLLLPEAAGQHC